MRIAPVVLQRLRGLVPTPARWLQVAWVALALWACGLALATWQLGARRQGLTPTRLR